MLGLYETLKASHLAARRNRDKDRATFLGTVIGDIENRGIASLTDQAKRDNTVTIALKSFRKKANDMLAIAGISADQQSASRFEINIVESFLPVELSAEAIEDAMRLQPATNIGQLMKFMTETYKGQYDGQLAKSVAEKVIGSR